VGTKYALDRGWGDALAPELNKPTGLVWGM